MNKIGLTIALSVIWFSSFSNYGIESDFDSLKYENGKGIGVLPQFPLNYLMAVKGKLVITLDSVFFDPYKIKHQKYRINESLDSIDWVKKWGAFIIPNPYFIPNMVKIRFSNGSKIILYTGAERKKIMLYLNRKKVRLG